MSNVGFQNFEPVDGYGQGSAEDIADLQKALSAGQDINKPAVAAGDGFALRVESLEETLKVVEYRMEHLRFYRGIPKRQAFNTVEEHNVLSSYGQNEAGRWTSEGALPEEDDSTYERQYATVKFLGVTRRVTHVMTMVRPAHGDVIAQETYNGTVDLLKSVERGLFYGDSSLSALQWDGYKALIENNSPATNVVDMRGAPLTQDALSDAALTIMDAPNYGQATHLHLNPKHHADVIKSFYPAQRLNLPDTATGNIGLNVNGFTSPAGVIKFEPNVFIDDQLTSPVATAVGAAATRPGTPTESTGLTTPVNAASLFGATDAGSYFYKAVAVNRYGKSAPLALNGAAAIAVAAGDDVRWGLTPGAGGSVDYYEISRSEKGGAAGSEKLILRIPNAAGAGEQTCIDLNANLPNTASAFMLQQNAEAMQLKQLAPLLKIPLAIIDASVRWMQLMYATPVLYAPGKVLLFKNVGRAAGYIGAP